MLKYWGWCQWLYHWCHYCMLHACFYKPYCTLHRCTILLCKPEITIKISKKRNAIVFNLFLGISSNKRRWIPSTREKERERDWGTPHTVLSTWMDCPPVVLRTALGNYLWCFPCLMTWALLLHRFALHLPVTCWSYPAPKDNNLPPTIWTVGPFISPSLPFLACLWVYILYSCCVHTYKWVLKKFIDIYLCLDFNFFATK